MGLFSKLFKGKEEDEAGSEEDAAPDGEAPDGAGADGDEDPGASAAESLAAQSLDEGDLELDAEDLETDPGTDPGTPSPEARSVTEPFDVTDAGAKPAAPPPAPGGGPKIPAPPPGAKVGTPKGPPGAGRGPGGAARGPTGKWAASPPPVHGAGDGPTLAPGAPKPVAPEPPTIKKPPLRGKAAPPTVKPPPAAKSKAPGAPAPGVAGNQLPNDSGFFRGLASDADAAFDALGEGDGDDGDTTGKLEIDARQLEDLHALFRELVANHVTALRELAYELRSGDIPRRWVEEVRPSIKAVLGAAKQVQVPDLVGALQELDDALSVATKETTSRVGGATGERILERFEKLAKIMPQSFATDGALKTRERSVVQTLFDGVDGLHALAADRLRASGLDSLAKLYAAKPDEVAVIGHLPDRCAQALCDAVREFREARDAMGPDAGDGWRKRLASDVETLRAHHDALVEADRRDDFRARRMARRDRRRSAGRIRLALTHLGEPELADALDREPMSRRIDRVNDYLADAGSRARTAAVN